MSSIRWFQAGFDLYEQQQRRGKTLMLKWKKVVEKIPANFFPYLILRKFSSVFLRKPFNLYITNCCHFGIVQFIQPIDLEVVFTICASNIFSYSSNRSTSISYYNKIQTYSELFSPNHKPNF